MMPAENYMHQVNAFSHSDTITESSGEDDFEQRKKRIFVIPSMFKIKYSKSSCILGAIIFVLIVIIIVQHIIKKPCTLENNLSITKSSIVSVNYSRVIILSDNEKLWTFDPKTKNFTVLPNEMKGYYVYDIYMDKTIFWINKDKTTINSFATEYPDINYPEKWNPKVMAIDFVTEKIYVVDEISGTLNVIKMNGSYYHRSLISNLKTPCDLSLDPFSGLMFIVQEFDSLLRANMDGTSIKTIIKRDQLSAITIDREVKIIFWANSFSNIASTDYEGNGLKILTQVSTYVESIAIFDDKIFWVTPESMWFCKVTDRACDNNNVDIVSTNNFKTIKAFSNHYVINNVCQNNVLACEHLCLLTSNRTGYFSDHSCACSDHWQLNNDSRSCETESVIAFTNNDSTPIDFRRVLVISDDRGLWTMEVESRKFSKLQTFMTNYDYYAFDIYLGEIIFWSNEDSSTITSLSKKYPAISYPKTWKPRVLKIDFVSKKFYIIDKIAESINVIDMEGKYYGIVVPDLKRPCELALDPMRGLMFVALESHSILKLQMNGSFQMTIAQNNGISAFTINRESKTIYWAINFVKIEAVDYEGERRTTLTRIMTQIDSLTIFSNKLFWISKTTLWSCTINYSTCEYNYAEQISFQNSKFINSILNDFIDHNPCETANGGCQQLCLLVPSANESSVAHTCACSVGWELDPDRQNCRPVTEFMLYTQGNLIKGRILDPTEEAFVDAILPTMFDVESLNFKDTIDFDYDIRLGLFFYSDDYNIYSIKINTNKTPKKLLHVSENYQIKSVAFDWVTGNLYYVQKSRDNSTDHSLMVIRITDTSQSKPKTITSFTHEADFPEKACPHSLIIHPNQGYLFYTAWNNVRKDIQRIDTTGKGLKEISSIKFHNKHRILGIDYQESRLYCFSDKWKVSTIHYSNFDGLNFQEFQVMVPQYPNTIYVHRQWMYLINSTSIWRLNKLTGGEAVRMIPRFESTQIVSDVRIVSPIIQEIRNDHPCAVDNGGCQQFCFATPQKSCACWDDHDLVNQYFCN